MEHHVSADIAYAVWQYWRATGDEAFLLGAGAEILLETARFWASRAVPEADGRRHIRHAIGPDEYHEDVDDNAFTNVMARWNIARALETLDLVRARWPDRAAALREKLALGEEEIADWRDAVVRIVTGLDPATGLFEQFAGFHALEPLDLAAYRDITVPIDVVIGRERTRHAQVVKQADVVALLALLPEEVPAPWPRRTFAITSRAAPTGARSARSSMRWPRHAWAIRTWRCTTCARPRCSTSTRTRPRPAACAWPGWAGCGRRWCSASPGST
jgi:trehalose/maltose hydrolase-like predicted phosphorylase